MRCTTRWLRRLTSATRRPNTKNHRLRSPRMNMLALEDRVTPNTYTVSLLGDSSTVDGSDTTGLSGDIRYCVDQANLNPGADSIVFSNAAGSPFLSATTITLTSTLALTDATTIDGAAVGGKNNIAISGGGTLRVFSLSGANLAEFDNISIINGKSTTGGSAGGGGAVLLSATSASVTFNGCNVANNVSSAQGGALGLLSGYTGLVTINNSSFSGNQATEGGALYFYSSGNLTISGSSFSGNKSTSATGGAFYIYSGSATITTSTFTNNQSASNGGAITINSSATVSIADCTFTGNTATTGGGVSRSGSGPLTISRSTFQNNTATTSGGGFNLSTTANVTIDSSAFVGNTSPLGGGINQSSGTITFNNGTVSGNSATGTSGGGGFNFSGGVQNIRNSTVAFNSAGGTGATGGGIRRSAGTLTLSSTIVGKNTSTTGGKDAHSTAAVSIAGNDNLIGDTTGGNITYTGVFYTGDPKLAGLTSALGGTTPYHPLQFGSPAVDKGNDSYTLVYDQRGLGYPRTDGVATDIGSFEGFVLIPSASASLPNVPPINPTYVATVTYSDETGINTGTIDTGDVRLTGPGYGVPEVPSTAVIKSGMMGDKSVVVEYTFSPPGGAWDYLDNGTYTLTMQASQVQDTDGSPNYVPAGSLGTFNVAVPLPVLVVDNSGDVDDGIYTAGQFTLREAIKLANNLPGTTDTITFAAALSGSTITAGTPLSITDGIIINGLGAANLAVSGGGASRVFEVSGNVLATFNNMSIIDGVSTVGGSGGGGGAIWPKSTGTSITVDGCVVSGHTNTSTGGAISVLSGFTGLITINNSTFSGNSGAIHGGAIYFYTTGNLNITSSKFINNSSSGGGGAINPWSVLVNIDNSTFANNTAVGNGGGLECSGAATVSITNSTFSGNTAALGGAIYQPSTSLTITNSTISGNKATGASGGGGLALGSSTVSINNTTITKNEASAGNGGGIRKTSATGTLTLSSTIVADNVAASGGPDINGTVAIAIAGGDNLIGVADVGSFTLSGTNQTGTSATPLNPQLGPLQNNGGATETHAVLAGSPASLVGNNNLMLPYDQRGIGYPRSVGGFTDIGATQGDPTIPGGKGTGPDIATVSMSDQTITVTYTVGVGSIDASTLDNSDIIVTGPNGYSKAAKLIGGPYVNAPTVVTQYTVPPNDSGVVGSWDGKDAGIYTINLQANQVKTVAAASAPAGSIGIFRVAIGQVLLVDNTGDTDDGIYTPGDLTFREALKIANDVSGTIDTITFSGAVFTAGTNIGLTAGYKITDSVIVNGPGIANLTFDGLGSYRVFEVADGTATVLNVSISGIKVQGGAVTAANGAGFLVTGEKLSLTNVEISSNNVNTSGNGGGISLTGTATLNLESVRITSNSAAGNGGGIDGGPGGATITINNSTIANNTNTANGPGISNGDVVMTITNSTISGNTSSGAASFGGGIASYAGQITIENSTISNNQASEGGGIGLKSFAKTLAVRYSTVTGNNAFGAAGNGGGIRRVSGTGIIDVFSSAVTGNIGTGGPDISSSGTVNVNYSAVFSNTGFTLTGTKNLGFGVNAKLGALQNNGGPTETHLPDQGSPLFNAGPSSTTVTFDQRGQARLLQGRVDIGSVEALNLLPTATMNALGPITVAAATPDVVTIVYTDNGTITATSIKTGNIQIVDTATMTPLTIISATPTPGTNAPVISVDYKFAVPGGAWSTAANDTYIVRLLAATPVIDNDGNPVVTADTDIGTFVVAVPATYLVDEATDTDDGMYGVGKLSLREAINLANGDGVSSVINFDASAFPLNTKIDLVAGSMTISEPVTINGPGRGNLKLDGIGTTRIFVVDGTTAGQVVSISGLTVQNGNGTTGGGIQNVDSDLTFTNVDILNNVATTTGGGIWMGDGTKTTLIGCNLTGNSVPTGTGLQVGDGGGIFVAPTSTAVLTIDRTTVSGNSANDDGGGIYFYTGGALIMSNSTMTGNMTSVDDGGGIYFFSGTATITNSTISGNISAGDGGGFTNRSSTVISVFNSTIAGNSATALGSNIHHAGGTTTINSTIVADALGAGGDISGTVQANFSLIENTAGWTVGAGSGSNVTGLDPLLAPLALNGAPAGSPLTQALNAGSPAINAGTDVNVPPLVYDQRGVGFNRKVGSAVDIGAFEVQTAVAPPTVSAVLTNGAASGQHSRVTSIVVNFSEVVTIANPSAAFQINRYAGATGGDTPATGLVGYSVAGLDAMNKGSSVTITFNGTGAVGVDPGNSLRDGKYQVVVVASEVAGAGGFLDGDGNGSGGDNNQSTTWRLFGDGNGDGGVTAADFNDFRLFYGSSGNPLAEKYDFDNSNSITASDFNQFRTRYGLSGYNMP